MKVGDWVKSYHQGVWQIYRILNDFYEIRWSLSDTKSISKRVLVFSKRVVNKKWQRSFSTESCEQSFIVSLTNNELKKLELFFVENPQVQKAFSNYQPKPIDLIMNISLGLPTEYPRSDLEEEIESQFSESIAGGVTSDDIIVSLNDSELAHFVNKNPRSVTIQFVCPNHKVIENEFIFERYRLLTS